MEVLIQLYVKALVSQGHISKSVTFSFTIADSDRSHTTGFLKSCPAGRFL